jgi:hypothetical protein
MRAVNAALPTYLSWRMFNGSRNSSAETSSPWAMRHPIHSKLAL